MSDSELNASPTLAAAPDTFCVYLAKQFVAKKGFSPGAPPEAAGITAQSDITLSYNDGMTMILVGMIDREAHPGKGFEISANDLKDIGTACLKYSGRVNGTKMPVMIELMEVGPGSDDQRTRLNGVKRSGIFSRIIPTAWVVDTALGSVWNSRAWRRGAIQRFIERLLKSPREILGASLLVGDAPPPVAVAPKTFPILTATILAVLCAVFAAEIHYGIGPVTGALEPTITTLIAFGGISRNLVFGSGEWYRLLSAPFVHVDIGHLLMNAAGLFIGGRILEPMIGRAWFGTVYVAGGLLGSIASVLFNAASLVSVGASGAIMGIFAAMLVVSVHFPKGVTRVSLQMNAMYVLIPSLLPLTAALQGHQVDYAAHFGGALGGAAVAAIMLTLWPTTEAWPKARRIAGALAIAGVIALAIPVTELLRGYPTMAFSLHLIPANKVPVGAVSPETALELARLYPRDPRTHILRASHLLRSNDLPGGERETRAALAEEALWGPLMPPSVSNSLRTQLAYAIAERNRDEALTLARPLCATIKDGPLRTLLDIRKLCAT